MRRSKAATSSGSTPRRSSSGAAIAPTTRVISGCALLAGTVKYIHQVRMPHWHGRGEVLHLLSVISPVAEDLALVYPPLVPVPLYEHAGGAQHPHDRSAR